MVLRGDSKRALEWGDAHPDYMAGLFQRIQGKSKEWGLAGEEAPFPARRQGLADAPSAVTTGSRSSRNSSMADPKGAAWSRNDESHLYWRETVCDFDSLVGPGLT